MAGRFWCQKGVFELSQDVTLDSKVKFEGTITQPDDKRIILQNGYNFKSYLDAFGDEERAFKKAYQALLNFADHESLDLCGRRISLSAPMDMQAADPNRPAFATRRVIRNGQFEAMGASGWDTQSVTSAGTYNTANTTRLTNVTNVANVQIGSLVLGTGVGREVYVTGRSIGAKIVYISQPIYDAAGTQTYTFKRFEYLFDFSGYCLTSALMGPNGVMLLEGVVQ
jgi:hypothetical protein